MDVMVWYLNKDDGDSSIVNARMKTALCLLWDSGVYIDYTFCYKLYVI